MTRHELLRLAWESGNLEFLVRDYQLPIYRALWAAILNKKVLKYILDVSRRFGKTHVSSIVAVEYAIRYARSSINYASPTQKQMDKILRGIMPEILETCPKDLLPARQGSTWVFNNGSIIYTAGVNNQHADDLRGTSSHLSIVDEAAQIDELKYLVESVLIPQQLTVGGTMLLLSTPPTTMDHDYTDIYRGCKEEGNVQTFTIRDNESVMSDPELLATYIKEAGGEQSVTWRREYLAEWVTDTDKTIVPEWDERFVQEIERPRHFEFYHKYVGADFGFRHFTAFIFGYYHFDRAALVIEDEFVLKGEDVTTSRLGSEARTVETRLGWDASIVKPKRIGDNSHLITINDLYQQEKYLIHPTTKDELRAMVGNLRRWVAEGRIIIHPRCEFLIGCLKFGVWDRSPTKENVGIALSSKYGHYDALPALYYLLRYIDVSTNPVPLGLGMRNEDVLGFPSKPESKTAASFKSAITRPARKRETSIL